MLVIFRAKSSKQIIKTNNNKTIYIAPEQSRLISDALIANSKVLHHNQCYCSIHNGDLVIYVYRDFILINLSAMLVKI